MVAEDKSLQAVAKAIPQSRQQRSDAGIQQAALLNATPGMALTNSSSAARVVAH